MQYNKSDFQGGMKLKFFSVTAPEKKEVETYSNVKNVLKCCPHSLLLKAVHFFLLSPLLWEKGAVSHCLSSLGIVSLIKKHHYMNST